MVGQHQKQIDIALGTLQASIANFDNHVIHSNNPASRAGASILGDIQHEQKRVITNHATRIEMLENNWLDLRNTGR